MAETLTPDICVIGGGSGGLTVAAAAASFGVEVVLCEKGKMGGDCLNYGCVPSKSMIAAANQVATAQRGQPFGAITPSPKLDYERVHDHIHEVIGAIAPHDSVERFESLGVRVLQESAQFIDPHTVKAGDTLIKARRFVVATGSRPAVPPIAGLAGVDFLTNETIFDLKVQPDHLIIIGAGPIGLELAQAQRRLGADVSVLEAFRPLPKDDPELAQIVLESIKADGVEIISGAKVVSVAQEEGQDISVSYDLDGHTKTLSGSHLLVAAGRIPNTHSLDLEKAGIEFDRRGIKVTKGLRTTNKRVYAIGDVAGGYQFTHVAGYHAGLVIRSILFRLPVKENRQIIPWATFTSPELAHVGLSQAEAEALGPIKVLRWDYKDNDRAQAERQTNGMIKVIINKRGRILGASIVGKNASEMISFWSLAISRKLKIGAIANYIAPYPTYSEISRRAAVTAFTDNLSNPWLKRTLRFLRWFG